MVVDGLLFYDDIEDFYHIEGCSYELDIARDQVYTAENAPADASLYRYRFVEIASEQCEAIGIGAEQSGQILLIVAELSAWWLTVSGLTVLFAGLTCTPTRRTGCETEIVANRWKIDLPWDGDAYAYEYVRTLDMDCSLMLRTMS